MRQIKPVHDNKDKQNTYRTWMGRYLKAMQYEFYYEAIFIDYAMLEDRLKSFLFHIGAYYDRESYKANKGEAVKYLKSIVSEYKNRNEKDGLNVSNISGKRKIIRCVLKWSLESENIDKKQKYLSALRYQCESLDTETFLEELEKIEKWCEYRNELIHALMNKNVDSTQMQIAERAAEGMELARYIDSQVRIIKKRNKIRKSINLPI